VAGKIIADIIEAPYDKITLNVGNTVVATMNASGLYTSTGNLLITQANQIGTAALPTGTVLQVVSVANTTSVTLSSSTFIATGLSASITPTSTTSKILVLINAAVGFPSNTVNPGVGLRIYRGATMLTGGENYQFFWGLGAGVSHPPRVLASLHYLDSPSTTSLVTYNLYASNYQSNGTLNFNESSSLTSITLMEIAG
jgi:hypothetical protein